MNILLTGSGGFIGKNLKEYLAKTYNLLYPRSFELNLVNRDEVEAYFKNNDIDFIIHCSSTGGYRTQTDKNTTVEENVVMVENLLNCKKENARVILFGSGAMYDKNRDLKRVEEKEIGQYEPKDLYGKSKLLISELIKNREDILCLNIFGCYGKYEKETRFPTYAIKQNLEHKPIIINQNVIFDYLYIDDLCHIIGYFINYKPENNIINITPDLSISLVEISEIINKISDYKSEIIVKNPNMNFEYTGLNSILKQEFPQVKFTSYQEGLKHLFIHIKESMHYGNKELRWKNLL